MSKGKVVAPVIAPAPVVAPWVLAALTAPVVPPLAPVKAVGARGRAALFADDLVITLLVAANPKRGQSLKRFAKYRSGMSVADYAAAVGDRRIALADLAWDTQRKFVRVAPAALVVPAAA